MVSVSAVIPAHNSAAQLELCLQALVQSRDHLLEIIVVDDGSDDNSKDVAASFGVRVLSTPERRGPASARNLGAAAAVGDVLLFLDSDVCVRSTTVPAIRASFEADPELDALIGSYDDKPQALDFISQYRNLMHSWVHHQAKRSASTFWCGCGAIRRSLFLNHSGFDEQYGRPAIEDIELGYRLVRSGRKIILDSELEVQHLKRWTFWSLVQTDVRDRGIPWTELILRHRLMPNDLNLRFRERASVVLIFVLIAVFGWMGFTGRGYSLIPLMAILFVMLARYWIELPDPSHPRTALSVMVIFGVSTVILAYTHRMFGLIPPVVLSPVLLFLIHRYVAKRPRRKFVRPLAVAYVVCSILASGVYVTQHPVAFFCVGILGVSALMNVHFYLFLADKRGLPFMLAAIPFHLLYHFYSGLAFMLGLASHLRSTARRRQGSGSANGSGHDKPGSGVFAGLDAATLTPKIIPLDVGESAFSGSGRSSGAARRGTQRPRNT